MSEHDIIELRTFNVNNTNESDTEYHEIKNEVLLDTTFSPETPAKLPNAYDFFTQFDVKSSKKQAKKKKKSRKKDSSNIMDIITSELASEAPLVKNVITKVYYSKEQESYLEKTPRFQKIYRRNQPWRGDVEHGWSHKPLNLSPVFPRVLENAIAKDEIIPVQYVEPVMFNDIISEYQEYDTNKSTKFLDIALKNITFLHHHDFSLEKLLSVKLIDCYEEYCGNQKEIEETLKNIEINKKTRDNLKQQLINISSNKKEDLRFDQTVLKYTGKFLHLKDKYYQMVDTEKELQHKVKSLWADIEIIRHKSGSRDTEYVIEMTNNVLDDEYFEKEWTQVFENEYSDMLDRLEYEYVNKYLEYKEFKLNYEAGDRERIKTSRPKLHIDQDKLKEEVDEIVNKIVVKEKTYIALKVNKLAKNDLSENKTKHNYKFKIYVDNVFVCESESITSQLKFNYVDFIDILSIQILPNNTSLDIFLCEDEIKVSSINVNLSKIRISISTANFRREKFVYNNTVEPTAQYIGSGFEIKEIVAKNKVRLKTSNMFKGKLCTVAEVNIKIGWSDRLNENQLESIKESMSNGRQIKRMLHGIDKPNVGLLTDIIENIYDKKVSDDAHLIKALQDACKSTVQDDVTFKINENNSEFVRLKLLHLRNSGGFDDITEKMVPLFASQISTEQLYCLQKTEEKEFHLQYLEANTDMDPIDLQRFMSVKYMEKLNVKLKKNLNEFLLKKTYKDVVRDYKDLSLRGIFSNQSNFDLEATTNIAKQQLLSECLIKEHEISITILRAFNLLDRNTAIISEDVEDNDSIAGFKVRPLRPFIRTNYHGVSVQSSTAIGCHPTWNHTMKIKTKLSPLSSIHVNVYDECKVDVSEAYSDEEPSSLSKSVHYRYYNKWLGTVQIPLYTVLSLGSLRGTFKITSPPLLFGYDSSEPKESKSIIPEVMQLMKKETSFLTLHITTNLFHLGGFQGYTQPVPNSEDDLIITHLNTFVTDYLNEFPSRNISLTFIDSSAKNKCVTEFLQPIPLPDSEWFPKDPKRTESAVSKSSGHSKSSSSKSSRRKLSIATNGEDKESESSVHENIWKGAETRVDPVSKSMDAAVRYVALIPTYEIAETHVVTLRGKELLKVLYGSPLDHTLLLACYFLHLGIRCWVVTGLALPRGLSTYVLVKYDLRNRVVMSKDPQKSRGFLSRNDGKQYTWFVYDAVSGERFELRDAGCPLKTVSYAFDAENIWVNIQSSQDCESVSFDFTRSSDWQPVFEDPLFIMKQPPLIDSGLYSAPPEIEQLRSSLEAKVKSKVQKWRSHMKTIWNRYCSSLLREMLPHWEYWAFNPMEPRPVPGQRLKQLMVTYKMFGFPLNLPYVSAKSVTSGVKSTGVHLNDDPAVEFGLAVEVYAYPNNVLSVWVFLASITRI
ncbi:protein CC2D2B [Epargyreus clarus]|uniref:protein CC2D2B n=1 Tax=Epargyreus clarus TaxID=520877 RepID=UPI003C2EB5C3